MFFRPTPSKLEQARRAALEAAQSALGSTLDSAQSLWDAAPQFAGQTAASVAGALQRRGPDEDDAVTIAAHKAEGARQAAELATLQAQRAAREADDAARAQLERAQRDAARQRAEFEAEQARIEERAEQLEHARHVAEARAENFTALDDEDDEAEPRVVVKEDGGSKWLLLVGGAVFVGAALLYFFSPKSGGRSRDALEDRLAKVKDDAAAKLKEAAESSAPPAVPEVPAPAANEKLAEVLEIYSTPTESAVAAPIAPADETFVQTAAPVELGAPLAHTAEPQVEVYEPLGHLETTGAPIAIEAIAPAEEVPHPNVFDKVAQIAGKAAETAEHLAGEDAVEAHKAETAPDAGQ